MVGGQRVADVHLGLSLTHSIPVSGGANMTWSWSFRAGLLGTVHISPVLEDSSGRSSDDCIRGNVLRADGASPDNRVSANCHARQYYHSVANPHVVTNDHGLLYVALKSLSSVLVILCADNDVGSHHNVSAYPCVRPYPAILPQTRVVANLQAMTETGPPLHIHVPATLPYDHACRDVPDSLRPVEERVS